MAPSPYSFSGSTTYSYAPATGEANRAYGPLRQETDGLLGNRSHAYDVAYNPTTFRSVSSIPYNAANQRTGTQTFVYDHHGNPTTYKGTSGLLYDVESHLRQYGTFTAGYNGDGLRVWKQVGATKTYYQYDGTDLVCEYNVNGTMTAKNFWGANGLLFRQEGSQTIFFSFDPQGSVVSAIDYYSNELGSWSYDAYGSRTGSAPIGPYLYGGQWGYYTGWDTSTGLILCTHRYYDPGLGRWLTRDPIGYEGGINLYGYVAGNPVNHRDPTGLILEFCWRRVTRICNNERCGHWFYSIGTDAYGYGGQGVGPIAPPTRAANNPSGYPVTCVVVPATPAQEQCVKDNYTGTRAGYNLCGRNWSRGDYDFRGLRRTGGQHPNCQDYLNCISRTCRLPTRQTY